MVLKEFFRRKKIISFLENVLLLNFSIFLLLTPYFIKVAKIFFCLGLFFWIFLNLLKYKRNFYRGFFALNPLNKPFLFFLIAALLSVVFSLNPYDSQSTFFERYLPYILFFYMGLTLIAPYNEEENTRVISFKNLYILTTVFIISGIVFGGGGTGDYLRFHPKRLFTSFGRRISFNMFPIYLVYYIPFGFILSVFSKKWLRILSLFSLIFLLPCWFWAGSRFAWIAVILSIFVVVTIFIRNKKVLLIFLLVLAICLPLASKYTFKRAESIFNPKKWGYRLKLLQTAVNIVKDYPAFGAGLDMYGKLFHKYKPPYKYPRGFRRLHAHNIYFEVASEMGIVGLLAFIWIFVVFLKNAFRNIRDGSGTEKIILLGFTGTIIATLIFAFAGSIIIVGVQSASLFWFLFGMASGIVSGLRRGAVVS